MIRILIQKISTEQYTERKNFIVKSTPTEITEMESSYGGSKQKVQCVEEYKTEDVPQTRTQTIDLLEQHILNEGEFEMTAVIRAINGIG